MSGFSREVSRRVFAGELKSSNYAFRDGDPQHQYAPQYLLTPTGARCNRVFLVGTLTERDDIGGDTEYWRGRIVDPTGSILIYAGQYQPEAAQILANIEPPAFVAVVGKPNLYQTDDGNVIISVRAEAIQEVDETTRNQWILDTARRTQERLKVLSTTGPAPVSEGFSTADQAQPASPAMDAERALDHYHTDIEHYRQMVIGALLSLKQDLGRPAGDVSVKPQFTPEAGPVEEKPDRSKGKADGPKSKPKSNTLSGWPNEDEDEVEVFNLSKKS
jgi:RPA family protein